jgi:hypothetical protein
MRALAARQGLRIPFAAVALAGAPDGAALKGCEKTVASEERSRCILGAPSRAVPWPWLPAGAQEPECYSEHRRNAGSRAQ